MLICRTIKDYKSFLSSHRGNQSIGFIPTMGYLHEGHLSLVQQSKLETDVTVMSVFVNPLQFGPNEDFKRYPRNESRDLEMMEQAGVDVVFLPTTEEMYPNNLRTKVCVHEITERMCGTTRIGHFDGVATVVLKLFQIIQPTLAYFGLKDAQQVAVIEQMVYDLNLNVKIVPCQTIREEDGLAKSSRNVYLSNDERMQASILYRTLQQLDVWMKQNPHMNAIQLEQNIKKMINENSCGIIEYAEVLSYPNLQTMDGPVSVQEAIIVGLAVKFGNTRLIDNRIFYNRRKNLEV
jgi:pantoate--beta-alanine ligase